MMQLTHATQMEREDRWGGGGGGEGGDKGNVKHEPPETTNYANI